ncbi:hypothetical protein CPB84DRAFT_1841638 [Gymnopilus junonius]|uniref:Uncharacterized protein n=1 Tax=Gymnopilus junonius TaxID=109634 RepID=A0A9P5P3Z7_GYMJU|nr:hypothetical protein CPB84DRAFT_1841638 [Gymnopilus junonius]
MPANILNLVLGRESYTPLARFEKAQPTLTLVVGKHIQGKVHEAKMLAHSSQAPNNDVVVKWSTDLQGMRDLQHEYKIYSDELAKLQGKAVPKCISLFKSETNIGPNTCLILEKCIPSPVEFCDDETEF